MPPRSRLLWQLVALLLVCGLFGLSPLAMIPPAVWPIVVLIVFGWVGPRLLRRWARRVERVQRAKNREFGPSARGPWGAP